jgi:hypothetical protein
MSLSIQDLNNQTPYQVLDNEEARERFIALYNRIHDSSEGEIFYEKEKYNLQRIISQSKDLQQCQGFSVYGTFLNIASMGITLASQGNNPYLYVLSRSFNEGSQQSPNWVKRMYTEVSPYGELALRIAAGQIYYADTVKIVYEGDLFKAGTDRSGQQYVEFEASIPRKSKKIIAAFVKVVRPDRSFDFSWMVEDDWTRLAGYSLKQNNRGNGQGSANALYTSCNGGIDPGFLAAKALKHAFGTFPKIALGQFATLSQTTAEIQPIDYGLDEEVTSQTPEPEPFDVPGQTAGDIPEQAGIGIDIPEDVEGW